MRFFFAMLLCVLGVSASSPHGAVAAAASEFRIVETTALGAVPSWFPVGFCLLTHGDHQVVAYYDEEHHMVVARRALREPHWQRVRLPSKVGWDSHNYITMAIDAAGDLHLAGNMHCVPLIYYRTETPGDITTFKRLAMTGKDEERCTYPRFKKDTAGTLLFMYRSGGSGNGRRFVNRYDEEIRRWTRHLDTPLLDGEGKRNAYPHGPLRGPDGMFHFVWVWRDTPDCATNHHLSYARSGDMKRWESAGGTPLKLPLTLDQAAAWVDPIPPGGGIINGCERLVFDAAARPLISYHKRDAQGHMQIYVARCEEGRWRTRPITAWEKPVDFAGRGAMPFIGIRLGGLEPCGPDLFTISYRHGHYGSGRIVLDGTTLEPVKRAVAVPREFPAELQQPAMDFPGIQVKLALDAGEAGDPDTRYVLRWETLGANHDRPRTPPLPPPSTLTLVKLVRRA